MAIGTQFSSLVIDLRAGLRRPSDVSVGVDDLDSLKRLINSVYADLLVDYEWPHLRYVFAKIQMAAGQRLYDFPAGFDPDNIGDAAVWLGSMNVPIKKGINLDAYSFLDPATDQRSDPPLAYDTLFDASAGAVQIEVWPIPASGSYTLQFAGPYSPPKLVNDSDKCWLDDDLVLGFAEAEGLASQGSKDAPIRLKRAESRLLKKKVKSKKNDAPVQVGLGIHRRENYGHPMIVIKPSG